MTSGEPGRATTVARALTLSWFAVALAAVAHLVAGGSAPGIASCLAVGALLTFVSMPLCHNAFRLTLGGPLLLVQQLATHVALSLASPAHATSVRPTAQLAVALDNEHAVHAPSGHLQHAASTSGALASGHALVPSPLMIAAHLGAAVLVAALLSRAEAGWVGLRALHRGHARTKRVIAMLIARLAPIPVALDLASFVRGHPRPAGDGSAPPPALIDLWRSPAPCRRGPPRPCAA